MKTIASQGTFETSGQADRKVALPVGLLVWSMLAGVLVVAGVWAAATAAGVGGPGAFGSGMVGIGLSALMTLAGVLVIGPWKHRVAADWMAMWLAGTVFRVLATPVAAFLLYSAASSSLAMKPFGLSVAVTYMVALFVEATVLTQHFRRLFPAP